MTAATCSASAAFAQTSPGFSAQQVLTAAGLNSAFVSKQDYLGAGANGNILTWSGTAPAWGPPSAAGVSSFSGGATGLTPSIASTGAVALGGTLGVANGGTGATTATGSGSVVLATGPTLTSPTLTTPNLDTPSAVTLTNATGLPLTTGVTGTLAVAHGGTGSTTSTGSGSVVLATSPTIATPVITGSATGANPSAGNVGEVLCAWVSPSGGQSGTPTCGSTSTTAVHLAITGAALNIATLTLTAGNWMVCGRVQLSPTGGTTINFWSAGISVVTGTLPSSMLAAYVQNAPGSGTNGIMAALGCVPVQTSSSLPLYLVGGVGGSGGTGIDSYAYISATRIQ